MSEKYWEIPFAINDVPIVFGGTDYLKEAVPGSYINAFDFQSPMKLVEYIRNVDNDIK